MAETKSLKIESYQIEANSLIVNVDISFKERDFVPTYSISIMNISPMTQMILTNLRDEFVNRANAITQSSLQRESDATIQERFRHDIVLLITRYFPKIDEKNKEMLVSYVMRENLGLGNLEFLLKDPQLEEIVVNSAKDPVWVFHKKHGWLKTNILLPSEDKIRHYATTIARDVEKEITLLKPLLDASLISGERVNATLSPISAAGNTITIRKFSERPWTVVDFIKSNTMSYEAAALIWLAVQNELSIIVAGGTGTGKTTALNLICNFFPPNQRIISIEDTRELTIPHNLHWVPLETRLPNPEGKGEITMLDLLVNSLRMRPDRIVVGEIRRKAEAEVLFEAMHTGHSVYATLHANDARETVARLTNPPLDIPKMLLPAVSLVLVQSRNRRLGIRRTFQIAEITQEGDSKVLYQHDPKLDQFKQLAQWGRLLETLSLFTGLNAQELKQDLEEKKSLLRYLVKQNITDMNQLGMFFSRYYIRQRTNYNAQ